MNWPDHQLLYCSRPLDVGFSIWTHLSKQRASCLLDARRLVDAFGVVSLNKRVEHLQYLSNLASADWIFVARKLEGQLA